MPIPLFHVLCPKGETAYSVAGLSSQQMAALIPVCLSGIAARFSEKPSFPYLGLIYRSDSIQVYAFISCTGWTLLIGLDCGSFDADEVARSFFERSYHAILSTVSNPFYSDLKSCALFEAQIANSIQSHSVMMTFMSSSQVLG